MSESKSSYCNCLYHAANAMARSISRIADEEFAEADISPTQGFIVMTVVKRPGIRAGDIAKEMQLTPSTITRMLDKLEERGLISRSSEGKSMLVYPTPEAIGAEQRIKTAWGKMYARSSKILGKEKGTALVQDLVRASAMLDQQD
ncbi:MAG: MarR family transcriptional regulator [Flavobacteriales bacterium]|nr:MarR family transcriptional regulator [Flavobacteriales bacterium]MBL0044037.1 MarR family transcriptional regulator [Flavobacteriales bacterium]